MKIIYSCSSAFGRSFLLYLSRFSSLCFGSQVENMSWLVCIGAGNALISRLVGSLNNSYYIQCRFLDIRNLLYFISSKYIFYILYTSEYYSDKCNVQIATDLLKRFSLATQSSIS